MRRNKQNRSVAFSNMPPGGGGDGTGNAGKVEARQKMERQSKLSDLLQDHSARTSGSPQRPGPCSDRATARTVFRRAASADIPQMSRIRLAVLENRLRDPARVTPKMYEDFLERDGRGWVAQVDGVTVAFSYANRIDGSIWALFVDPAHEGQGLAKQLLTLATAWLFEQSFAEITLSTGAGTRAEQFYARQGWDRQGCVDDEVSYCLPFRPG